MQAIHKRYAKSKSAPFNQHILVDFLTWGVQKRVTIMIWGYADGKNFDLGVG
jgi:hypothetical protein